MATFSITIEGDTQTFTVNEGVGPTGPAGTVLDSYVDDVESLSDYPASFTPSAHTQAASTISDSTATGQSLMTAANASAARTTLELGNAALATTSTGGNGAADSGKVAVYFVNGGLQYTGPLIAYDETTEFYVVNPTQGLTAIRTHATPNASGVKALTGNLSGIPDKILPPSAKTTPVDADTAIINDSEASGVTKTLTFANLWTWIKSKIESVALFLLVKNYTESVVSIGTVTTSNTLALTNGTRQRVRLTASTECTFTMPTATDGKSFVLEVEQAATTGLGTAVFTGVDFGAAGAPTITPTAGKMDIVTFMANGSKWFGSCAPGFTY